MAVIKSGVITPLRVDDAERFAEAAVTCLYGSNAGPNEEEVVEC
jgi:hypothetical protein